MSRTVDQTYVENFTDGPGGWIGFAGNTEGPRPLEIADGAAVSRSPWWVDYNHAPPGAGYLHILFMLHTKHSEAFGRHRFVDQCLRYGGTNHFVEGGFGTDLRDARLSVRVRGELQQRGARVHFLAIAKVNGIMDCSLLIGQPIHVTKDWSWQTLELTPDPSQWRCLGVRHDRGETYGRVGVEPVLRDVNLDIMFVLFPLDVAPAAPFDGDPHRLRAGEDYPVDPKHLPQGCVMLDEVRIEMPGR